MRRSTHAVMAFLPFTSPISGQTPRRGGLGFWADLNPGPFAVGFRIVDTVDATRSFPSGRGRTVGPRPMRMYLSYPAAQTGGAPICHSHPRWSVRLDDAERRRRQSAPFAVVLAA